MSELSEVQKVRLFASKMEDAAADWFERVPPAQPNGMPWTSDMLIELLRQHYWPKNRLYQKYSCFKDTKQGTKPVKEYAEAFQEAISHIDTGMNEAMKVMTFINGLAKKIRRKMLLMTNRTLNEAINNAKMVESSMKMDDDKSVSILEPSISDDHLANLNSQINTLTTKLNNMATSNNNSNHNSSYNNYNNNNYDANQSH